MSGCGVSRLALTHPSLAFFRLVGLDAARFITLKARVLAHSGTARIDDLFGIGHFLVLDLARIRPAQKANALGFLVGNDQVFIGVRFLAPAVMLLLFRLIFSGVGDADPCRQ